MFPLVYNDLKMALHIYSKSGVTHHTPASVDYFGRLVKKANKKRHELVLVVELLSKQNLADDVGGGIVEQQFGIHGLTW